MVRVPAGARTRQTMKYEREIVEFVEVGRTLYDRGYATGAAGNMSMLLCDGNLLATPTGSCMGRLVAEELSVISPSGELIGGKKATKEVAFHMALYAGNPDIRAVVHLHSCYCTALACLKDLDAGNVLRPFTPYVVMRMGEIPLIPYYRPGSPKLAEELGRVAAGHLAFLMANHGMIACGRDLTAAVNNAEELEATAKLYFVLANDRDRIRYLTQEEIRELR